jgi:hypothetical protein
MVDHNVVVWRAPYQNLWFLHGHVYGPGQTGHPVVKGPLGEREANLGTEFNGKAADFVNWWR